MRMRSKVPRVLQTSSTPNGSAMVSAENVPIKFDLRYTKISSEHVPSETLQVMMEGTMTTDEAIEAALEI
jgi:hypothetical protein